MLYEIVRDIYYKMRELNREFVQYKYKISISKDKNVVFGKKTFIDRISTFDGKNFVGSGSVLKNVKVGYGTYINSDCYLEGSRIGKYCSIANNVRVVAGNHPTKKFVSTHPAFYSRNKEEIFGYVHEQLYNEFRFADEKEKIFVEVGHDVWIGAGVTLIEGIKVGNGAIIAANATVTKDVAPYEIVAGIPAKKIKSRFSDEQISFLLSFEWWNKDLSWIKKNAVLFSDIERFIRENE